jgi:glycosyltransferase involved in cell wall biosynthesis
LISVVITTYGEDLWRDMAWSRAYPSTQDQGAYEVIVHHEPDLPIGPARNRAAAKATGEWLLFLDADDELEHEYINAMTDAICSDLRPEPAMLQPAVRYLRKGQMQNPIMIPVKDLSTDNFLVIGTVVRRKLFQEVGGFNDYPHGFEDWSLWAKCWKAGAQVFPVPRAIYNAHINPQSKHRQMWRDRKEQVRVHLEVQAELFPGGIENWAR